MKGLGPIGKVARKVGLSSLPIIRTEAQRRILDAEAGRSQRTSILFFTTHKCASTFISKVLQTTEMSSDLRHFDYAAGVYRLGDAINTGETEHTDVERVIERNHERLFFPKGEIYGPLRRPIDIPGRESLTQLFFLRDPRDVIVSAYYSFGFSHGLPPNSRMQALFLAERDRMHEEGIDQFALRTAREWMGPTLRTYADFMRNGSDAHYLTYDSYKDDPAGFLERVFGLMGADVDRATIDQLAREAKPIQAVSTSGTDENPRHQRSGRSGQFKAELADETVSALDDILGDVLDFWEFSASSP